ncbi:DMT family transporter [Pseudothioclava arenosa]|uniref:EamA family transporter n=1 Tax=Pseudothioclava arenosa TaxID=1795308 RepID=A0A2A4CNZ3_9RHOB|nr:DMT family transporter [Pseudothioclava arenosa]PCD75849.1 EamA family transporter [Pseudothioclava arenosa]
MENVRGSLLMVLAMAGFALEDMFVKSLSERLPVGEVLALLGAGGAMLYASLAIYRRERLISGDLLRGAVIGRNLTELIGTMAFVCAIAFTPLAQASAILQATPLAVTLGAALFLGEQVGWRRWSAIVVGFIGVLIVIRPGTEGFSVLSLLAVAAVIGLAARDVITRRVPKTISSLQLATYGFASVVPAGFFLMWLRGNGFVAPAAMDWAQIGGAILFGTGGYYALIAAMRIGEVSVITPFRYTRLLFALVIGWLVFSEPVDQATLWGGAVIVASGLYTLWRQARARRR